VNPWFSLHMQHREMRSWTHKEPLERQLRRQLTRLANMGHCPPQSPHQLYASTHKKLRAYSFREHSIPLRALPKLSEARLTLKALVDRKKKHIHAFTAMIQGISPTKESWIVAIHLDDDLGDQGRRGRGACSHAAFHCHIGPTLDRHPKVRVPLPGIGASEALDWMLTLVLDDWEPAPWEEHPS